MSESALRLSARLVREGAVLRAEVPELELPDVRQEVERRLADVGLELATSVYSEHVGVRQSAEVTSAPEFDAASNVGLRADACALLVVLWARLVLQKRTASDERGAPGQSALFARDAADASKRYSPQVRIETLHSDFGHVFGSREHLRRLVTQLRRLGFAAGRGDVVEAGPFLELGVDGERMIAFIRRGVLATLLDPPVAGPVASAPPDETDLLAETLASLGGSAAMAELRQATGREAATIRPLLHRLEEAGRLRIVGERRATRYHLVREDESPPPEADESAGE